jgi:alkanesulfonate monooxygenase SsuD/methylene tetrahydromethanopterin reductase-like flavin-dependent oxidoreductase (luciferase family)
MRVGLMVRSDKERSRADRLAGLIADGAAAESAGFTTFWMPQVPGYLDAMTAVTLIGQATDRIEIGTAVVPIQTRHPMIMAQQSGKDATERAESRRRTQEFLSSLCPAL